MIRLEEKDNATFIVHLNQTSTIGFDEGLQIKNILKYPVEKNSTILIDLDGVEHLDSKGYGFLSEVMAMADNTESKILFTNIPENLSDAINNLRIISD